MTQLTLNLKNDSEAIGEMKMSFSPVASLEHANLTHKQEKGSAKKMSAIYGQKCLESFGKFSHVGSWAKTFSALLIGQEDWYSTKCKLIWRLKGTKYSRMYFQLQPSTLPTEGIGFGLLLLKTPSAMDAYAENLSKKEQKFGNSGTLAQEIATGFVNNRIPGLFPTPTAMDSTQATANMKISQVKEGSMHSVTLSRAMNMGMLPTPMASDCGEKVTGLENQDSLVKMSRKITGTPSQLSPQFVLEMMGFPTDWTELPFQNGDKNQ